MPVTEETLWLLSCFLFGMLCAWAFITALTTKV